MDINLHFTVSFCAKLEANIQEKCCQLTCCQLCIISLCVLVSSTQFKNYNIVGSLHFQGMLKGTHSKVESSCCSIISRQCGCNSVTHKHTHKLSSFTVKNLSHANTVYLCLQYIQETAWDVVKNTVWPCFSQCFRRFPSSSVRPWTSFCFHAQQWVFTRHFN